MAGLVCAGVDTRATAGLETGATRYSRSGGWRYAGQAGLETGATQDRLVWRLALREAGATRRGVRLLDRSARLATLGGDRRRWPR
jgi:hypothetical protein